MSTIFYRAVIQAVLLFGAESWALQDVIIRTVNSTHVGFLNRIMGKRSIRKYHGSWDTPASEEMLWAVGIYMADTYIGRRQSKVENWVSLQPLFGICMQETIYEGVGRNILLWWRHTATSEAIGAILEES